MSNVKDMLDPWKGRLSNDDFKVMEQYVTTFKEPWGPYDPLDMEFVKHCIELNKRVADLPDDDPYIKKYFNSEILY